MNRFSELAFKWQVFNMHFTKFIILFLFSFSFFQLKAQTCCSAGAPITSSFDITGSEKKGFAFRFNYEYNSVNLLIDNNKKLVNDPRTRNGQSFVFKTDFSLNKNWAFSVFLPIVLQNRTTFSEEESATGLGDLTLLGQYTAYVKNDIELKWAAGIKLPTGHQYLRDSRGIVLSPDMQSGTGTLDFIGRMAIVKRHIFIQNLSNQTSFSYRYNATNNHFGDPEKIAGRIFKFGNEAQLTSAFSYLLVLKKWFIIPEMGIQIRHTTPNQEQNANAPNSGGLWFRIPVGVQLNPNDKFSMRLFGEIPAFQDLEGLQITTNYKLGLSFGFRI